MQVSSATGSKSFFIVDEEGRVYVSISGQPESNAWSMRCNGSLPVIAHGNTEEQIRQFAQALADAFNRHAK